MCCDAMSRNQLPSGHRLREARARSWAGVSGGVRGCVPGVKFQGLQTPRTCPVCLRPVIVTSGVGNFKFDPGEKFISSVIASCLQHGLHEFDTVGLSGLISVSRPCRRRGRLA
jgi:hypothetical protein